MNNIKWCVVFPASCVQLIHSFGSFLCRPKVNQVVFQSVLCFRNLVIISLLSFVCCFLCCACNYFVHVEIVSQLFIVCHENNWQ